ncbi:GNAT family N-acetyltransferase [Arcanobacterium haemolyticum]|uniref:GCN5-related N-acetyltransferase n=1 Tax=Arcanobacterium haemolyticum (strain ATCC 9345 / DSM 20595 / CCM 5947 / CCUG 17215 / LMG 16163 / NBRC 15585 / NCTC 8452 / 11018) TaxID=644284 RepID=D7BN45_ARCHD|nr:GNAT family N-acetyltransferase [Arcanobacterium haemolyticum]ADH92344.1 GCN5-related N-acetyltransferase [Arcanobacterium haemolyticum DSM 20595]QCX46481.1 GNAT family N-acetyltransferase [Arcanobacterium haemolyticum]SQH28931.1 Predicted acetyltransferase [Arcanobacterium haemolyticum]
MIWPLRRQGHLRRLVSSDSEAARDFLNREPVESILARVAIEARTRRPAHAVGIAAADGRIQSLCWVGANIIPLGFDEAGLDQLATYVRKHDRIANSIVGPADQVLGLWERIQEHYAPPRDIREHQLSMVWGRTPHCVPDLDVRPAQLGEGTLVVPASVSMFIEEVGYDPTIYGPAYAQRVHTLVREGRTFLKMGEHGGQPRVDFKADIGALAGGVAQIQGVWVHPDLRGHGIAAPAMAHVAHLATAIAPTISLYVNDYNIAAVRTYEKAGFDVVGEYATILLT